MKNFLINFFILSTSTIISLFLIEGLLSFFRFDKYESSYYNTRSIHLREYPPLFRTEFKKEYIKNNILSESLKINDYVLEVDSNGFIIPSRVHKSPNFDIVFLGGSTVECALMPQNKRFPYIVGRKLELILKKKINSYNSGVSGNNSLHSLNILLNKIVPMQPKCVFMMHNINDLVILYYTKTYWNKHPTKGIIINSNASLTLLVKEKVKYLCSNSFPRLTNLLKERLSKVELVHSSDEWEGYRQQERKIDEQQILNAFERNLLLFISICKINKIEPILMTQFNRFTDSPDRIVFEQFKKGFNNEIGIGNYAEMKIIYDLFNAKIREVCIENDVKLVDLALLVPQERSFMYDSVHLNEIGSVLVGDKITDFFLKNHLESIN